MTALDANKLSMLALAHVGDAVYELLTRTMLCTRANSSVAQLHKQTVSYVNAPAQARAAEKILPLLDAEEASVYRRGRNAKKPSHAKHAAVADYNASTGFEAVLGYLYLSGEYERLDEILNYAENCER